MMQPSNSCCFLLLFFFLDAGFNLSFVCFVGELSVCLFVLFHTCRFYLHPEMKCGILSFNDELKSLYNIRGVGLNPTTNKLIVPWGAIDASWMNAPGKRRAECSETNPGHLVLSPAPGEQFDLSIQLADQMLNFVFDNIYMVVEKMEGKKVEALIQLNGLQYGRGDR